MLRTQITFRNMSTSLALRAAVDACIDDLQSIVPSLSRCRVVLEAPPLHQQRGGAFAVHVDVVAPWHGSNTRVSRLSRNADPYVAVRDAFDTIRRALSQEPRQSHDTIRHWPARASA